MARSARRFSFTHDVLRLPRSRPVRVVVIVVLALLLLPYAITPFYARRSAGLHGHALALDDGPARRSALRAAVAHFAVAGAGGDHRRGWPLLQPLRRGPGGNPRCDRRRRRSRRSARRLHHHPAGGEEPVPLAGPQLCAQGAGISTGAVDRPCALEAAHPGNLPQHCRMGTERRIRRRGRQPARLRQAGPRSVARAGGVAGGHAAQSARPRCEAAGSWACGGSAGSTRGARPARPAPTIASKKVPRLASSLGRNHPL